jgi:hypothetical protein
VLRLAGIDTSIFKAHSTRSASTSAATKLGVPLQDIMSSAGWSSNSTFGKCGGHLVTFNDTLHFRESQLNLIIVDKAERAVLITL